MLISARYTVVLAGFVLLMAFARAQEPVKPPLSPRIITATRQVSLFTGLEKQMLQAVQKKDKAALQAIMSDDCAIHIANSDLMPGDEWVDSVMSKDFILKSFVVRQVGITDLGDAVIVGYDRIVEATYKGSNDGGEFYVVDVWKKAGENWKLADRYVSKVSSTPNLPKTPVKPTGKQ
ncbi:MAG TPA: nuclear transport factor 2 family protein [Candidatus Angelobacter sp.]|jgi:ketosteroid isomerase-like protein|nr:nuclear transport factor 2 family protein [Candidatus Angelobacter sp.]